MCLRKITNVPWSKKHIVVCFICLDVKVTIDCLGSARIAVDYDGLILSTDLHVDDVLRLVGV